MPPCLLSLDKVSFLNETQNVAQNVYLVSVPHFFMESPTCLIQCHQLWTSFSDLSVELFWLFSKPFYSSSFNFIITCEMNFFEMFRDSCKQPGVRQCQIWPISRGWNNFTSGVYCRWIGFTPWGVVLLYWRNITFFPPKKIIILFQPVSGLHICLADDFHTLDH